jgi:alkanesulfonate monooxygenase SsuD/methylene tetrahydromethanopterin reductase-like flavin-dependent oxidoreductase (luciferase family)
VRFYLFHLMPYPAVPDEFDARPSASITVPNSWYDPQLGRELYNRYLDELELAEALGFDGVCLNEHHQSIYGLMPSPNIVAAMLARRTSRVEIAIVGNAIPVRGNPLRVAEEIAMLDVTTGGRIVSGFVRAIGGEYFNTGVNPTQARERFLEAHDLIVAAWTRPSPFRWTGKHYRFNYVNVWPRPLQQPHPPIWVPGLGSSETIRWIAEQRYTYLSVFRPPATIKPWFDRLREHARDDFGYEAEPGQFGLLLPVYVGETDEQAHADARPHLEWLFHKGLRARWQEHFPPGYLTQSSLAAMLRAGGRPELHELPYEAIVGEGFAVVGSAETIVRELRAREELLGCGILCALLQFGDMPHERTVANMERFAAGVMPAFR